MNMFFLSLITSNPCEDIGVLRVILFIKSLLSYALTLIPFGIMLMISIDFFKNVVSSSEEQKKNFIIFIRRCIYLIIIFLIPTIVSTVVNFFDEDLEDTIGSYSKCLAVTSESIDLLVNEQKKECIDGYEWDDLNNICVYVGKDWDVIDGSQLNRRNTNTIPKNTSTIPSSNGNLMKAYSQSDPSWKNYSYCYGKNKKGKDSTIGTSGCGATAIASVVTGYGNDHNATPKTVRDFLCNNNLHGSGGLAHDVPVNSKLLNYFGLTGFRKNIYTGSNYSESTANLIKSYIDSNHGIVMLIPGHYIALGKGGCGSDEVRFYSGSSSINNSCVTMKELWNKTYNWRNRCSDNGRCGWDIIYVYNSK
ncbi:MAG: hypothetical protein IJI49_00870 [Bacilli bacterium]|nr:hypothetical protein [Bacilli bacterium]